MKKMNQRFEPLPLVVADAFARADAPGLGNPSAPIQLVVFWDYECPYCAKAMGALKEVHQRFPNQVRVAVAQYPLPLHAHAALAAEAALSAHAQGQFWAFSETVFAHQDALERADLLLYASQAKLDPAKVARSLDAHEFAAALQRESALGDLAHIGGTPTLYVNRQPCSNPTTVDGVLACVDTARKTASNHQPL
jgi:protein-disulfide isomerase